MTAPLVLLISALCGVAFGYAAQRGSLCVISAVESVLERRSPRVFLSFLRCSVWVIAVTVPLAWAIGGDQFDVSSAPTLVTVVGGLLFGVGAAINGGCSFGTLIRLGAGDASFAATLAGMALGFVIQQSAPQLALAPAMEGRSVLEEPTPLAIAVLAAAVLFCLRELVLIFRRKGRAGSWAPERAALAMGIAGGILYALEGSWAYTLAIDRSLATMRSGGIPDFDLGVIFLACVAGAALAARRFNRFEFRLNAGDMPKHLLGGTIMGIAAAMIPGGNDVLVLHSLPALSPHAPLAYVALVLGAAGALGISSSLRRRALLPGADVEGDSWGADRGA